jgi:hypothetical protein
MRAVDGGCDHCGRQTFGGCFFLSSIRLRSLLPPPAVFAGHRRERQRRCEFFNERVTRTAFVAMTIRAHARCFHLWQLHPAHWSLPSHPPPRVFFFFYS